MYRSIFIFVTVLFIVACNSGSETESNEYVGFWKLDNTFLEITDLGTVILYSCTLADGYTRANNNFGYVVGNEMILNALNQETSFKLSMSSERIIGSDGELNLTLYSAELPTLCDNGIEIVYNSPTEAIEGELTNFTIDFDYRLTTASEAVVRIAVASAGSVFTLSENHNLEIQRSELGRGSFTLEATPFISNGSEEPFSLQIYLMITPELDTENSIIFYPNVFTNIPIDVL